MIHHNQSNTSHEAVQLLVDHGFDSMAQAIQILMNEALKIERTNYLNSARKTYANGFKPQTVNSCLGKLQLQVRQTRYPEFYRPALEWGERSERARKLASSEMYVQGVSTRKVAAITAELY